MGLFGRAGRVLYRTWGEKGPAGRVLYRKRGRASRAGRVLSRRGTALVSCCRDFVARCAAARPGHIISTGIVGLTVPSVLVAVDVCSMRSWLLACCRRVGALDGVIPPPIGGGDLAVCGGVVAKLQTHSVKRVQIRLFRLNRSTIWRNRSLSWCVVRASPPEHAPQSLVAHSSACRGSNRLTSCESCYIAVLSSNEAKSGRD